MTLMLHAGAEPIEYGALRELETPKGTASHIPLPHYRLVDLVANSLGYFGHEVVDQHHGVTEDGNRYFGVLTLRSPYTGYSDQVGLRNSHDKSLPVGIALGSVVWVCDNLAFSAEHVIRTKHTAKLKHRLPGLVSELVEPIADQREAQHRKIVRYQATEITDAIADHAIITMFRQGVIGAQRIAQVLSNWDTPELFEEGWGGRTAWRLFNCVTYSLEGKVAENPHLTEDLHKVIDGVCEHVH